MKNNSGNQTPGRKLDLKNMALVTFGAGCLTFLVAGLALGAGLLLDARMATYPRWTLILLAGSAPITLGVVYWAARRSLRRMRGDGESREEE
jgi:ABC-type nickel/cobalt efflux system permease component RcnA